MDNLAISAIPSFVFYCFVQGITPGPANLCSLSTTMRYGTVVALRQWVGLLIGFFLVALASVGIAWGAQEWFSRILPGLSMMGALYVIWLAWKTLRPARKDHGDAEMKPTILSGILVQVSNVKVILVCLSALLAYVVPYTQQISALLAFGMAMPFIGLGCNMAWIIAGSQLRAWYEHHRRSTDIVMAAALLLCALGMVVPIFQ